MSFMMDLISSVKQALRDDKQYQAGYKWAAAHMLATGNRATPYISEHDDAEFERGVYAAQDAWDKVEQRRHVSYSVAQAQAPFATDMKLALFILVKRLGGEVKIDRGEIQDLELYKSEITFHPRSFRDGSITINVKDKELA